MATSLTIIKPTLQRMGNSNPTTAELEEGLVYLQDLISEISTENFSIFSLTTDTHTLTASTASYTFGTGGDLNSARPVSIDHMFLRDANSEDSEIELITEEEYNEISSKDTEGIPAQVFYNPAYPLASFTTYPVADVSTYVLHIKSRKKLQTLTLLDDTISMPDEYIPYLKTNLLFKMASLYGYIISQDDLLNAQMAAGNVKTINAPKGVRRTIPSELWF
jgi:hypothetical protein